MVKFIVLSAVRFQAPGRDELRHAKTFTFWTGLHPTIVLKQETWNSADSNQRCGCSGLLWWRVHVGQHVSRCIPAVSLSCVAAWDFIPVFAVYSLSVHRQTLHPGATERLSVTGRGGSAGRLGWRAAEWLTPKSSWGDVCPHPRRYAHIGRVCDPRSSE